MKICDIGIHRYRIIWDNAVYWRCKDCGKIKTVK